jgi:hypothetical protein
MIPPLLGASFYKLIGGKQSWVLTYPFLNIILVVIAKGLSLLAMRFSSWLKAFCTIIST